MFRCCINIKTMKFLLTLLVLAYRNVGLTGFLLDTDPPTGTTVTLTSKAPDGCSIETFADCMAAARSLVDVNGSNINIDQDAFRNFYCGPNVTNELQCLRDRINPNCGPDTDAAFVNETLSRLPPDYSYDSICRNTSDTKELLRCQTLLPNIQGFRDCITGETLNKTVDPTNTCKFFEATVGCSYKYTEIMCPSAIKAFKESANYVSGCTNIDYEKSEEAKSCDEDMQEACDASYNPPSYDVPTELVEFVCSGRMLRYKQCLHKVHDLCKDKDGFNATKLDNSLDFFENQTAVRCSGGKSNLLQCTAVFPKISAFQDCVTGVTLNKVIDLTDTCKYLPVAMGCSTKYTDLMCPEHLDELQKTTQIPPHCNQDINNSQEAKSCDSDMKDACTIAYNPPTFNGTQIGESMYDFVCRGQEKEYITCLQKVNSMCSSQGLDVSTLLSYVQYSQEQTAAICSDKTGYIAFADCMPLFTGSDEYTKCMSKANVSDTCGTLIIAYKCTMNAIEKPCPNSASFYNKYIYSSLKACKATGVLIPVVSSSNNQEMSVLTLVVSVCCAMFLHFFG